MAQKGLERRAVAEDNLAGQADIKPVFLSGGGIRAPSTPPIPASPAMAVVEALGQFAGQQLKETANARRERMKLDGATMAVQGVAYDQVELNGGDKWASEGHALMTGNTTSSALVAAQVMQIDQGGYAMDADQFRANYTQRMEDAVQGQDPAVATAIRDEFTKQMPSLVERHTVKHAEYVEKQTFDALVTSIDIISQDPTGEDKLINFASVGEDSASAYLSPERKAAAVARGVQVAFRNDNPAAYGILRRAGLLEQMTLEQRTAVEAAKDTFQTRMRTNADSKTVTALEDIVQAVKNREITYDHAQMRNAEVLAQAGIDQKAIDQKLLYQMAGEADNLAGRTMMLNYERAVEAGDVEVQGEILADVMEWTETRGRNVNGVMITSGANKGTRAQGITQIMPLTSGKPGYGVRPAANDTPSELRRTGRDYWKAMLHGKDNPVGSLPWEAGDWFSAGVAYNWGPGKAIKWFNAGADPAKIPQETKEWLTRFKARMERMGAPTLGDKFNKAVGLLSAAKQTAVAQATDEWQQLQRGANAYLMETGDLVGYRKQSADNRETANLALSAHTVAIQNAKADSILAQLATDRTKAEADAAQLAYKVRMHEPTVAWEEVMKDKTASKAQKKAASDVFFQSSQAAMQASGVQDVATEQSETVDKLTSAMVEAIPSMQQRTIDLAEQEDAIRKGSLGHLDKKNKEQAFDILVDKLNKKLAETENTMTGTPTENEAVMAETGMQAHAKQYVEYQHVPDDIREAHSAALLRGLINEDGSISKDALTTMRTFMEVKKADPSKGSAVAKMFLNPKAYALAESVLFVTGHNGLLEEGMITVGKNLNPISKGEIDVIVKAEKMQADITKAISDRTDSDVIGVLQAVFSPNADIADRDNFTKREIASLRSPEIMQKQRDAVATELRRLAIMNPENRPEWMLDMAVANVSARSANIGGDWVQMTTSITQQMFGDKANNFEKDGLENQVIMEWLASPDMVRHHPGIDDVGGAEFLPDFLQDTLEAVSGGFIDFTEGLSTDDAIVATKRGVRPFRTYVDPHAQTLYVQIVNREGNAGETITIDLEAAGKYYMERHKREWRTQFRKRVSESPLAEGFRIFR